MGFRQQYGGRRLEEECPVGYDTSRCGDCQTNYYDDGFHFVFSEFSFTSALFSSAARGAEGDYQSRRSVSFLLLRNLKSEIRALRGLLSLKLGLPLLQKSAYAFIFVFAGKTHGE